MKEKFAKLLSVKSIVTVVLTVVFSYLSIIGKLPDQFLMIYTTVIAFYFGTQHEKKSGE
jgi:hypothetical protein